MKIRVIRNRNWKVLLLCFQIRPLKITETMLCFLNYVIMIEFYHKYFKKSYRNKVIQMITDIERLLLIENVSIKKAPRTVLPKVYREGLKDEVWNEVK